MKPDDWRKVVDVNMTGSWFAAQAVGKYECLLSRLFRLQRHGN